MEVFWYLEATKLDKIEFKIELFFEHNMYMP